MDSILNLFGLVPAIIFPVASALQLYTLIKNNNVQGVNCASWFLFGTANVCLFIYTEKYDDPLTMLALLGTATINYLIAFIACHIKRRSY